MGKPCHDWVLDIDLLTHIDLEGVAKGGEMIFPLLHSSLSKPIGCTLPNMGGLWHCNLGIGELDFRLGSFDTGNVTLLQDKNIIDGIGVYM